MKNFLVLLLLVVPVICSNAQDLPQLSPHPSSVTGINNCNLSLNGVWKFQTPSIRERDIEVPGEWAMQDFDVPEGETAVYSREFTIPDDWNGKLIKLRFDGVSSYGLVKVNGQTIGEHEGGMVPFEMDITAAIKPGTNKLQIDVKALTVSDRLGCVSQYAVHTVGGLLRKVSLYALPKVNMASLNAVTELDKSLKNAMLNITAQIAGEIATAGAITVEYVITDGAGKKITAFRAPADKQNYANASLKVNNAQLWNPERPYLYTLTSTLFSDGKPLQVNTQKIGLRQVKVDGSFLTVNGQKVKLHGVNRHETHPLRGRSLTPELCRQDAGLFRAGNCNYIRTSHYPPSEEFLDACDSLGLFVECEAAITWIQHGASPIWKLWNYEDEKFLPYMVRANLENIAANRHHPSVIIWSLGNESLWSKLWEQVLDAVKKADPSRPTSFHDQCWGGYNNAGSKADIANYHYPGLDGPAACDTMKRPTLFGEYAHLSCYNRTELASDPGVRASFGKPLVQMYDSMYYHSACLGGAIWSGIDDIFHLSDGRILGYGPWGPVDGWRREKPEYTGMKKAYTPFRLLDYQCTFNIRKRVYEIKLSVENRYDFTNLSQATIEYGERNNKLIRANVTIPPRSKGEIILIMSKPVQELYLRVTDPRGFVCAEEILTGDILVSPEAGELASKIELEETSEAIIIHSENVFGKRDYTFSKITGLMTRATTSGKVILQQGPVFCLMPMDSNDGGKPNVAGETYQNNIYPEKTYPLYTLFATTVSHEKAADGSITVETNLTFHKGHSGLVTYRFTPDNRVEVAYTVTIRSEKEISPRQYGLLFQMPKSLQNLVWKRKGEFSLYPGDDIARTEGSTQLNASNLYETEAWRKTPQGQWKDDANIFGSVDFRSTKTQIQKASLTDDQGNGIYIAGNGSQALRAWLQDGCIQLLVADYNNGGSEPFYGSPFTSDRIKIKNNDVLEGKLIFELK